MGATAMSSHKSTIWGREPVLWIGLVQTLTALGLGFGLDLSTEQVGSILAVTAAVLAFVSRQPVTANVNVVERVENGKVVAGPANDQVPVPGEVIRDLGHHD